MKESLYFHAAALEDIQEQLVAHLRRTKEIGPADIKDLLGVSRKYAIPLLEYFDAQRVTVRVGRAPGPPRRLTAALTTPGQRVG